MAVSASKTFVSGEILTATELNTLNTNILNNGEDLGWPSTKARSLAGFELQLDADGDTSITADTPNVIDIRIGGTDRMQITDTDATFDGVSMLSGSESLRRVALALMRNRTIKHRAAHIEANHIGENQTFSF